MNFLKPLAAFIMMTNVQAQHYSITQHTVFDTQAFEQQPEALKKFSRPSKLAQDSTPKDFTTKQEAFAHLQQNEKGVYSLNAENSNGVTFNIEMINTDVGFCCFEDDFENNFEISHEGDSEVFFAKLNKVFSLFDRATSTTELTELLIAEMPEF